MKTLRATVLIAASVLLATSALAKNKNCPDCIIGESANALSKQTDPILEVARSCPEPGKLELEEARKAHAAVFPPSLPTAEKNASGLRLRGTNEELRIFGEIVAGNRTPSNWPDAAANCPKLNGSYPQAYDVRCVLSAVFESEESALRALVIAKKTGYIVSLSQEKSPEGYEQIWKPEEVRAIHYATQDLPFNFLNLKTFKQFYRVHDDFVSPTNPDAAAIAHSPHGNTFSFTPGHIVAYFGAFKNGVKAARTTMVHELAHQLDYSNWLGTSTYMNRTIGFEKISWEPDPLNPGKMRKKQGARFVTDYSQKKPAEDFAESVENYIHNPRLLRTKAPEKYDFLKTNIFGGQEKNVNIWPPLATALKGAEAKAQFSIELLACLRYIGASQKTDETWIWEPRAGSTMLDGHQRDNVLRRGKCAQSIANQIISELDEAAQTEACLIGSGAVSAALDEEVGPLVGATLDAAYEFAELKAPLACAKGDKTDKTCFWESFTKAKLEATPAADGLSAKTLRELSDQVHRLVTDNPFVPRVINLNGF